jgi:CHAT domain-containing protein
MVRNQEHLYAREIRDLALKSQPLVVMSACQTGLGKVFPGGVFGLARAWYYAGAPQIVTSLWNINDAATNVLMSHFIRARATMTTEAALRTAMLETRTEFPDPALWAGFSVLPSCVIIR